MSPSCYIYQFLFLPDIQFYSCFNDFVQFSFINFVFTYIINRVAFLYSKRFVFVSVIEILEPLLAILLYHNISRYALCQKLHP